MATAMWALRAAKLGIAGASGYVWWSLSRHLSLGWDGDIWARCTLWGRRDGCEVVTIPMIHFASREFYQMAAEACGGCLVLTEGLYDRSQAITTTLVYRVLLWSVCLFFTVLHRCTGCVGWELIADVAEASQWPRRGYTSGYLVSQDYFNEMLPFVCFPENADLPAPDRCSWDVWDLDFVMNRRNAHLLRKLDARVSSWYTVAVPWGAAHMPAFHDALVARGFRPVAEEWCPVFSIPAAAAGLSKRVSDTACTLLEGLPSMSMPSASSL